MQRKHSVEDFIKRVRCSIFACRGRDISKKFSCIPLLGPDVISSNANISVPGRPIVAKHSHDVLPQDPYLMMTSTDHVHFRFRR